MRNTLMSEVNPINGGILSGFRAIPFLQELKVIIDYTFTQTSLDLFKWFQLEDITFQLFTTYIESKNFKTSKVGQAQTKSDKTIFGWIFFIGVIFIIILPILIFSDINVLQKLNPVLTGGASVGLYIDGNLYPLYSNAHLSNLTTIYSNSTDYKQLSNIPVVQQQQSGQIQKCNVQYFSDDIWSISTIGRKYLVDSLSQYDQSKPYEHDIRLYIEYSFNREFTGKATSNYKYPSDQQVRDHPKYPNLNITDIQQLIKIFNQTQCDTRHHPIVLENSLLGLIQILTNSNQEKIDRVKQPSQKKDQKYEFQYNMVLESRCQNETSSQQIGQQNYFIFYVQDLESQQQIETDKHGMQFYILSDKFSQILQGYSILTLYTSVIILIGRAIRLVFAGKLEVLIYGNMPNPQPLFQVCQAIDLARAEHNILQEYILFYQLLDILRSPEVIKKIAGSYNKKIDEKQKQQKEELDKKKDQLEKHLKED